MRLAPSLPVTAKYGLGVGETDATLKSLTSVDWSKLPAPSDDGAADHLEGLNLPSVSLAATNGLAIDLASLSGLTVVYAYPMTGRPDTPLPEDWDMIPGARGCTPQSCAFRDHFADLTALGVNHLFGLSVQPTGYQVEAATRLHLPFPLLSDADYQLTDQLTLPTFDSSGIRLLKRLTLIIRDGQIIKALYPVFPPDQNAQAVMDWLISQS
jgi:peroxiredoxin